MSVALRWRFDAKLITREYLAGTKLDSIAAVAGCSRGHIVRIVRDLGLPPRRVRGKTMADAVGSEPDNAGDLADNCSGADIVQAIKAEAQRLGLAPSVFARPLSPDTSKWLCQTELAKRPKLHTIERVRALLAGELVAPPPPNNFQRAAPGLPKPISTPGRRAGNGLSVSEAAALQLYDAGYSIQQIVAETTIAECIVRRAAGFASEANSIAMQTDLKIGSRDLREAVMAESAAAEERRRTASKIGNVAEPVPIGRPTPVARFAAPAGDNRPFSFGREPCGYCGTRGDIGCHHQRPDPVYATSSDQGADPALPGVRNASAAGASGSIEAKETCIG